jgi:hypothetical protein
VFPRRKSTLCSPRDSADSHALTALHFVGGRRLLLTTGQKG